MHHHTTSLYTALMIFSRATIDSQWYFRTERSEEEGRGVEEGRGGEEERRSGVGMEYFDYDHPDYDRLDYVHHRSQGSSLQPRPDTASIHTSLSKFSENHLT